MTKKVASKEYDFICPQFVDFCSGVEGQGTSYDGGSAFPDKRSEWFLKSKYPIRKQNPQNRILCSTPFNKHSFVNTGCRSNNKDSEKINHSTKKFIKRQSKSVDSLLHLPEEKNFPVNCRKRSVSAAHDRSRNVTRPVTPECLKRSLCTSKNKTFKTTEELELEKIAELQQQTYDRLRANEVSMRRLRMKQTFNVQKDSSEKETEEKRNVEFLPIEFDSFVETISVYTRNVCSQIPREVTKGQRLNFNSELRRANHLNKVYHFIESQSDLAGPSNTSLTSVRNDNSAFLISTDTSHSGTNTENIQSMKFLVLPLKSKRSLFQESGKSPP